MWKNKIMYLKIFVPFEGKASISDLEPGYQDNFNARVYGKEGESNKMLLRK